MKCLGFYLTCRLLLFTGAGGYKTLGSGTKDFSLMAQRWLEYHDHIDFPWFSNLMEITHRGQADAMHTADLHHHQRTPSLRNLPFFSKWKQVWSLCSESCYVMWEGLTFLAHSQECAAEGHGKLPLWTPTNVGSNERTHRWFTYNLKYLIFATCKIIYIYITHM